MTTRKTKTDDEKDESIVTITVDGRKHYCAAGSAAERELTAKRDKGDTSDASPAVAEG